MQFSFISKIKSKIHRLRGTTIIQFGPPRSGTTLVYNILKNIFPDRFVETRHYYRNVDRRFPAVVTYRNPLDSIVSYLLIMKSIGELGLNPKQPKLIINKELIDSAIKTFEKNGIWTVIEIQNNSNVLMLKYENFFNNYNYIFDKLEKFFKIKINIENRNLINKKINIEATEKVSKKMESYRNIDFGTLFHGNHININKGKPNYHKEFLNYDQILYIKNIYEKFLLNFDYI